MSSDLAGLSQWTGLIIAVAGAAGTYLAYRLNKRGQSVEATQKEAANRLATRAQAFDELESLNDRLRAEVTALHAEIDRMGQSEDRAIQRQANRCRTQLEGLIGALATLQGVVLSEVATSAAGQSIDVAKEHIATDHPDHPLTEG